MDEALRRPIDSLARWDWEKALYIALVVLALTTRFAGLGDRVQSHDESLHTRYSWDLYAGRGFQHTPLMHGPSLFQFAAFAYYLFGDTDGAARLPVALIGSALVALPFLMRRWLGRAGALATSTLLLISPAISYYSRYIRHDIPIIFFSLIVVVALMSYLASGREHWLYCMAVGVALMFATMETAFIYSAIFGFFLIGVFLTRTLRGPTGRPVRNCVAAGLLAAAVTLPLVALGMSQRAEGQTLPAWWALASAGVAAIAVCAVCGLLIAGLVRGARERLRPAAALFPRPALWIAAGLLGLGLLVGLAMPTLGAAAQCAQQRGPETTWVSCVRTLASSQPIPLRVRLVLAVYPLVTAVVLCLARVLIAAFRGERSLDLIVVLGALCLPFLTPLVVQLAQVDPVDYAPPAVYYSVALLMDTTLLALAIGLAWDLQRREGGDRRFSFAICAGLAAAIGVTLFTSIFTNGVGIVTGLIGSLGYWLAQHDVRRGGQPWYYYLITVPQYEYLPLVVAAGGAIYAVVRVVRQRAVPLLVVLAIWWSGCAWVAYSIAGEKMPWLTVHIALPMILLSGWTVGQLLEGIDWHKVWARRDWLIALAVPLMLIAGAMLIHAAAGGAFLGTELSDLAVTGRMLSGLVGVCAGAAVVVWLLRRSGWRTVLSMSAVVAVTVLGAFTTHTAWRFCFLNYDYATEMLVYAHSAPAVKETMQQIDDLSRRTAQGSEAIQVAYGADGSWPFNWYLRNYRNAVFYGSTPSRESMEAPIIIAGREEWGKVEPYLGDDYTVHTYTYLWWPAEDYRNLSWPQLTRVITDTQMQLALWNIWLARDYAQYDELTGKTHTLDQWPLRNEYRLYIRRDIVAQMWDLSTKQIEAQEAANLAR